MRHGGFDANFADFGVAPVALDFYLDAFEGPSWAVKPFRNRSGWLTISEARFPMSFTTWRKTLAVCITDQGEVLSKAATKALFSIPTSLPKEADEYEPDIFEAIMDDRELDFMREIDMNNFHFLADYSEWIEMRVTAYEAHCRKIEDGISHAIRFLRAERRRLPLCSDALQGIDAKLVRLSEMADVLGAGMRERIRGIRAEIETVEAEIISASGKPCILVHRCTVRWRAISKWGCGALQGSIPEAVGWREDTFGTRLWYGPMGWGYRSCAFSEAS